MKKKRQVTVSEQSSTGATWERKYLGTYTPRFMQTTTTPSFVAYPAQETLQIPTKLDDKDTERSPKKQKTSSSIRENSEGEGLVLT